MHKPNGFETNDKIKSKISSNLEGINEQSRNYIKDIVILVNKEIGVNKILSILLFGSQRSNQESTIISDCDLLFIFKNRVSSRHIKEIEKYFIALEIKHNFRESNSNLVYNILSVIQQSTGMFVSHFLTKEKFWEQAVFHKIFQVNKVFSTIFAPRNIVLGNVIENSTVLYGEDLRDKIKPKIRISMLEMFRSTVMNIFISFFALFLAPFKKLKSIKYQLEALKWTLRSSNYYCFRDSELLSKIIERFVSLEKEKNQAKAQQFFSKFIKLRKEPSNDLTFMFRNPIRIMKIHVKAIIYKKMVKGKKFKIPQKYKEPIIPPRTFPIQF
ncbi:MAG: hypothetical protein ACFE85_00455 [Candidatus Hodarchaeota archaeon]